MLTKTIERPLILPAIGRIAKCEPRQYHNGAARMSRAVFQHNSSVTDISCSYHKIKLILK